MPRHVVFYAPVPTEAVLRFLRAAAKLDDLRLLGVVHVVPEVERPLFYDIERVDDADDPNAFLAAVDALRARNGVLHRIVGPLEGTMERLAQARERHDVAGTTLRTATLFREKARMKDRLRAAGLPVARHRLVASVDEGVDFVGEVGLPVVVKPPAGVGARDTFRVRSMEALRKALEGVNADAPKLVEEMIVGREYSFETVTLGGEVRAWSCSRYLPGCLEVLEKPWIQWCCLLPRSLDAPVYERAHAMGVAAIRALGLADGMTHMEWFEREDGSLAIGEIAARPPGPQLFQMTGLVHDIDPHLAWARAEIDSVFDGAWQRRHAAGTAFVRGVGHGRVAAVTGVRDTWDAIHPWLVEAKLPTPGRPKVDSYEGDGYVVVQHDETDGVVAMLKTIVETLRVRYDG